MLLVIYFYFVPRVNWHILSSHAKVFVRKMRSLCYEVFGGVSFLIALDLKCRFMFYTACLL